MPLTVRNLEIGRGIPKICVPVMGKTPADIDLQLSRALLSPCHLVEWRSDGFEDIRKKDKLTEVLQSLREKCKEIPLIFTLRTSNEGGLTDVSEEQYEEICMNAVNCGVSDFVDVEIFREKAEDIIQYAHSKSMKIIASNHDFRQTPSKDTMAKILKKMYRMDADILKLAVMPNKPSDVLDLLAVTNEMKAWQKEQCPERIRPIITISMGEIGKISRIAGKTFGSDITFGIAEKASAPGQIQASALQNILETIYPCID